ncbi:hypothetical protein M1M07_07545 [Rhodococcus sp. HM1]|uniref:hypothetical protein n=1 Tax=Rhodococcus sp. HM1 TaxID=2937759 RepID=UPI002009F239|nr:hypothetical protein [Rhodococcus sp. HM1]MCK8670970.1 hypothetical protein [Rhodococcus sp. HM1]
MADYAYDQQIEITAAGITIGGTPVPGLLDQNSVNVYRAPQLPDHWIVTATFVTGKEPIVGDGVSVHPAGSVSSIRDQPLLVTRTPTSSGDTHIDRP